MSYRIYQTLQRLLQERSKVVLATVIQTQGSTPRQIAAKMIIQSDGSIWGTIGGGAGEAKVIRQALKVFQTGEHQQVEISLSDRVGFQPFHEGICGGSMRVWLELWQGSAASQRVQALLQKKSVYLITPIDPTQSSYLEEGNLFGAIQTPILLNSVFIERIQPDPTLVICGGGHVGLALARCAYPLDFQVILQDDRLDWPQPEVVPAFVQICHQPLKLFWTSLHPPIYVALVTRGYQQDLIILRDLFQQDLQPYYLGMMGSRRRIQSVFNQLRQEGLSEPFLSRIQAPIGLQIQAETPDEIAVSICAALIQVRRQVTVIEK